jgi:hypothetical protein
MKEFLKVYSYIYATKRNFEIVRDKHNVVGTYARGEYAWQLPLNGTINNLYFSVLHHVECSILRKVDFMFFLEILVTERNVT